MKELRSDILYYPNFLPNHSELYSNLLEEFFVHEPNIVRFGGTRLSTPAFRTVEANSYTDFVGLPYRLRKDRLWGSTTGMLAGLVASTTGIQPTVVVRNFYRDGQDYLQPHSDYDVAAGPYVDDVVIATVSFGSPRTLYMQRVDKSDTFDIVLDPGSLYVMCGDVQRQWVHSLPQEPSGSRLSLVYLHHQLDPEEKRNWALAWAPGEVRAAYERVLRNNNIAELLTNYEGPIQQPVLISSKEEVFTAWCRLPDWQDFIVSGTPIHGKDTYFNPQSWKKDFPELVVPSDAVVEFNTATSNSLDSMSIDDLENLVHDIKDEISARSR